MSLFANIFNHNIVDVDDMSHLTTRETIDKLKEIKVSKLGDIELIDVELERLEEHHRLDLELNDIKKRQAELAINIASPLVEFNDDKVDTDEVKAAVIPTPEPGEHIKLTVDDLTVSPVVPKGNKTEMAKALAAAIKN